MIIVTDDENDDDDDDDINKFDQNVNEIYEESNDATNNKNNSIVSSASPQLQFSSMMLYSSSKSSTPSSSASSISSISGSSLTDNLNSKQTDEYKIETLKSKPFKHSIDFILGNRQIDRQKRKLEISAENIKDLLKNWFLKSQSYIILNKNLNYLIRLFCISIL